MSEMRHMLFGPGESATVSRTMEELRLRAIIAKHADPEMARINGCAEDAEAIRAIREEWERK